MIQRVQSIYLGIVILLNAIITIGVKMVSFHTANGEFVFYSSSVSHLEAETQKVIESEFSLAFIIPLVITLMSFVALMAYKKIKRQLQVGRTLFLLYLLAVVGLVISLYLGKQLTGELIVRRELGIGFFMFIIGLPFSYLANLSIKRDKNLLDSLNRLR